MQLAIRTGLDGDWEGMRQTFIQAGQAAWGHILPATTLVDLIAPDRWRPGGGTDVLVADCRGEVTGFVCLSASEDDDAEPTTGEIDACYAHPSVWGTGVGRALVSAAATQLRASGFQEATLWTDHRNYRPLRFYHNAGWRLDGAERHRMFRDTELLELRHRRLLPWLDSGPTTRPMKRSG